ncbi:MAG: pantetheine-phosphate adenylyltransferase [Chloroflexi bacterium]|nr:pantetheine-phosphate adenylyltransferase [Chloroflexota bacterium]MBU1746560.1 pantetheine-phosphate adenylyltransferase [Chloroflexota bacterium]
MAIAIYPGSFDPITNGHIDVARRAARVFDRLVIAIYAAPAKAIVFSVQERVELARQALADLPNVTVEGYGCLTVDFAAEKGALVVVRGLRTNEDLTVEYQLALTNRKIAPDIDTVCFLANPEYSYIHSSAVKEVARLGGRVDDLVPPHVAQALRARFPDAGAKKRGV